MTPLNYFPLIGNVPSGWVSRSGILLPVFACPDFTGRHTRRFPASTRQPHVFSLTMAAEVSVHFPARPFGPQRVFPGGGKAVN